MFNPFQVSQDAMKAWSELAQTMTSSIASSGAASAAPPNRQADGGRKKRPHHYDDELDSELADLGEMSELAWGSGGPVTGFPSPMDAWSKTMSDAMSAWGDLLPGAAKSASAGHAARGEKKSASAGTPRSGNQKTGQAKTGTPETGNPWLDMWLQVPAAIEENVRDERSEDPFSFWRGAQGSGSAAAPDPDLSGLFQLMMPWANGAEGGKNAGPLGFMAKPSTAARSGGSAMDAKGMMRAMFDPWRQVAAEFMAEAMKSSWQRQWDVFWSSGMAGRVDDVFRPQTNLIEAFFPNPKMANPWLAGMSWPATHAVGMPGFPMPGTAGSAMPAAFGPDVFFKTWTAMNRIWFDQLTGMMQAGAASRR